METPEIREIFISLRKAKRDFDTNPSYTLMQENRDFIQWLNDTYGIQLFMAKDGHNLSNELEITSEQKYMFFVLKYLS